MSDRFHKYEPAPLRESAIAVEDMMDEEPPIPRWIQELDKAGYNSEDEGCRPIRPYWPKGSCLTKEQFTIDEQTCLDCGKKLGYALPMNKTPNIRYLFCLKQDGSQPCRTLPSFFKCFVCGNYHTPATLNIVSRPGNSAYEGPSEIYQFMCSSCHKDQMENEPGVEECQKQMAKIRASRQADKMRSFGVGVNESGDFLSPTHSMQTRSKTRSFGSDLFHSSLEQENWVGKRKRATQNTTEEKKEDDCVVFSDFSQKTSCPKGEKEEVKEMEED
jgi:hypothetical protein